MHAAHSTLIIGACSWMAYLLSLPLSIDLRVMLRGVAVQVIRDEANPYSCQRNMGKKYSSMNAKVTATVCEAYAAIPAVIIWESSDTKLHILATSLGNTHNHRNARCIRVLGVVISISISIIDIIFFS